MCIPDFVAPDEITDVKEPTDTATKLAALIYYWHVHPTHENPLQHNNAYTLAKQYYHYVVHSNELSDQSIDDSATNFDRCFKSI